MINQGGRTIEAMRLTRCDDALVQDRYSYDEWRAALKAVEADFAIGEIPAGMGVFVEHLPDADDEYNGLRLHVPRLGSAMNYDGGEEAKWDERIRDVIRRAAKALGMSAARPLCTPRMHQVDAWLDNLGRTEGKPLTKRERELCTTLLYTLATAGWLVEGDHWPRRRSS